MDIEQLIICVQSKNALWDQKCKTYHNRKFVKKMWDEVAEEMNCTSTEVKSKWRNIRDNFRRELAKVTASLSGEAGGVLKKSRWAYFENMLFLKENMTSRDMSTDVSFSEIQEDSKALVDVDLLYNSDKNEDEEVSETTKDHNKTFRSSTGKKRINEQKTILQSKKRKETVYEKMLKIEEKRPEAFTKSRLNNGDDYNKDSNYMFFMSLLPQMRELSPLRNMHMRLKIQQLFLAEEEMKVTTGNSFD